jgi:hypothetical protein
MAKAPLNTVITVDGSTDWYEAQGTIVQFMLYGTPDSGSVAVELKAPDGTAVPLCDDANTPVALTVIQAKNVEIPAQSSIRGTVTGGGGSMALGIKIAEVSDGRTQY